MNYAEMLSAKLTIEVTKPFEREFLPEFGKFDQYYFAFNNRNNRYYENLEAGLEDLADMLNKLIAPITFRPLPMTGLSVMTVSNHVFVRHTEHPGIRDVYVDVGVTENVEYYF